MKMQEAVRSIKWEAQASPGPPPQPVPAFPVVSALQNFPSISQTHYVYIKGTLDKEAALTSRGMATGERSIKARLFLYQPHNHYRRTSGQLKNTLLNDY